MITDETLEEMRATLARVDALQREIEIEARIKAEVERRLAAQAARPRRSAMSALDKSKYITEYGIDQYQSLDW
jgi:anti-sigma-K factor RskA